MTIDYTALGAIIGLVMAIMAIIAVWMEHRMSRIAMQNDLLSRLYDCFYEPEMRLVRRIAARKLLSTSQSSYELEEVLNRFTALITLLLRAKVDVGTIYDLFDYWLTGYWLCVKKLGKDSEGWISFGNMVNRLESHRRSIGDPEWNDEGRMQFLRDEAYDIGAVNAATIL